MTDFKRTIPERPANLESEVERLNPVSAPGKAAEFGALPGNATAGKDHVAYRFGCSLRAVVCGETGTHRISRVSRRPLKFIKREIDAARR